MASGVWSSWVSFFPRLLCHTSTFCTHREAETQFILSEQQKILKVQYTKSKHNTIFSPCTVKALLSNAAISTEFLLINATTFPKQSKERGHVLEMLSIFAT